MNKMETAKRWAETAHFGQARRYTGEKFIVHPKNVVDILEETMELECSQEAVITAWLHDTIEDTSMTLKTIVNEFGVSIANNVKELTNTKKEHYSMDTNRLYRRGYERFLISESTNPDVHNVRLADLIDNCISITEFDPNFAPTFLWEMRQLINVLYLGHPPLILMAKAICDFGVVMYYSEYEDVEYANVKKINGITHHPYKLAGFDLELLDV